MNTTRWQRIESIFEEARRRAPAERAAFLDESCGAGTGADADVRAEVESLLASDERSPQNFMRPPQPISATADAGGPDPLIGRQVGSYTIKSVIAAGGMGTVYEAVQHNPERIVALKMLRAGITSSYALRHFEYESRVLARLSHPNIAQIYQADTYTPDGGGEPVPYFAMEYIEHARTLTEYADEQQLDTRQRLKLFAEVCEAVHHGHQKGIIHRDLKPGNILVDAAGRPKIIDFGIARSTDADVAITTMQTSRQHFVGTLQYMSPEQCEADPLGLDTRSDVYSLGVVLYELLCGRPPYDIAGSSLYLAPRIICEQPPERPSTIRRAVRGDLERIVLKALEKDREQRYQSADDLAQDLRRHLRGDPITARPPGPWTHLYRFARRHPILASACGSIAIAATILIATLISIELALMRPARLEVAPDGSTVKLFSVGGAVLHKWPEQPPYTFNSKRATIVKRPRDLGAGSLGVIGFGSQASMFTGALCVFELDGDLEKPIWCSTIRDGPIPTQVPKPGHDLRDFVPAKIWIHDIFPDLPGEEIVVVFEYSVSQCAIRIYDLRGELLYQRWHDGTLFHCYWMWEADVLFFAGLNSEHNLDERGYPGLANPHARVLFGLKPELGSITSDFFSPEPDEGKAAALWYRCLRPLPDAAKLTWVSCDPPRGGHGPGSAAEVTARVTWEPLIGAQPLATVGWIIDERGRFVPESLVLSDDYRRYQKQLPDPEALYLGDLPPVVTGPKQELPP